MEFFDNILTHGLVQRLGWMLVHFVWQAAAVALVLAILLKMLRKSSANERYIVACLALVIVVVLPVVTMSLIPVDEPTAEVTVAPAAEPVAAVPAPVEIDNSATAKAPVSMEMPAIEAELPAESIAAAPAIPLEQRITGFLEPNLPYLVMAWLAGVLGLSVWYLGAWTQLQKLRRKMVKPVDDSLASKLKELSNVLGINKAVAVVESALVESPAVVGWLKPVILMPASILTGFSADQIGAILAHELAHIKRCDYLVNMLQTGVEILGFYHPAVWWISRKIRLERENCCDDIAVKISGNRMEYAKTLAMFDDLKAGQPHLAVAAGGGSLFHRICRLAQKDSPNINADWKPSFLAILLVLAMLIPTGYALTARSEEKPSDTLNSFGLEWINLDYNDNSAIFHFRINRPDDKRLLIFNYHAENIIQNDGHEKGSGVVGPSRSEFNDGPVDVKGKLHRDGNVWRFEYAIYDPAKKKKLVEKAEGKFGPLPDGKAKLVVFDDLKELSLSPNRLFEIQVHSEDAIIQRYGFIGQISSNKTLSDEPLPKDYVKKLWEQDETKASGNLSPQQKQIIELIESNLPENHYIQKIEENGSPFYYEKASGIAVYVAQKPSLYVKQQGTSVIWLMPSNYQGRFDSTDKSPKKTSPPAFLGLIKDLKIYTSSSCPQSLKDKIIENEVETLNVLIKYFESQCTPAKGWGRPEVERRFGKGVPTVDSKVPDKQSPSSDSRLWAYNFWEYGTLLVRYDNQTNSQVLSANFLDPYSTKGRTVPAQQEQLRELQTRLKQIQQILKEYKQRFKPLILNVGELNLIENSSSPQSMKDEIIEEIKAVQAEIKQIESQCSPPKGTPRKEVEKLFGKPLPQEPPAPSPISSYRPLNFWFHSYKFSDNITLHICYDKSDNPKVESAFYTILDSVEILPPQKPEKLNIKASHKPTLADYRSLLKRFKKLHAEFQQRYPEGFPVNNSFLPGSQVNPQKPKTNKLSVVIDPPLVNDPESFDTFVSDHAEAFLQHPNIKDQENALVTFFFRKSLTSDFCSYAPFRVAKRKKIESLKKEGKKFRPAHAWPSSNYSKNWLIIHKFQVKGVSLSLSIPKTEYTTGQEIPAELTFTNTNKTEWFLDRWYDDLERIGQRSNLRFVILDEQNHQAQYIHVEQFKKMSVQFKQRCIKPGQSIKLKVTLNKWYDLSKSGKYTIGAIYASKGPFEMRESIPIWEGQLKSNIIPVSIKAKTSDALNAKQLDKTKAAELIGKWVRAFEAFDIDVIEQLKASRYEKGFEEFKRIAPMERRMIQPNRQIKENPEILKITKTNEGKYRVLALTLDKWMNYHKAYYLVADADSFKVDFDFDAYIKATRDRRSLRGADYASKKMNDEIARWKNANEQELARLAEEMIQATDDSLIVTEFALKNKIIISGVNTNGQAGKKKEKEGLQKMTPDQIREIMLKALTLQLNRIVNKPSKTKTR